MHRLAHILYKKFRVLNPRPLSISELSHVPRKDFELHSMIWAFISKSGESIVDLLKSRAVMPQIRWPLPSGFSGTTKALSRFFPNES